MAGPRCAVAGAVAFEPEPLHEYTQHGSNVLGSRSLRRWPLRALWLPYARHLLGGAGSSLPTEWGDHYLENVIEPELTIALLNARSPDAVRPEWMDHISTDSTCRDIAHLARRYLPEARARRLRRESVDLFGISGRIWAKQFQRLER